MEGMKRHGYDFKHHSGVVLGVCLGGGWIGCRREGEQMVRFG